MPAGFYWSLGFGHWSFCLLKVFDRIRKQPVIRRVHRISQEQVNGEDQHERPDKGGGGGSADTLRARCAVKATITTDEGNCAAEKEALEDATEKVKSIHELFAVSPVVMHVDFQNHDAVKVAPDHPHEVGHDGQRRYQKNARQEPRHDEI